VNLTLHIWRQKNASDPGRMVHYEAKNVNADMSFLEMLDVLNEELTLKGEDRWLSTAIAGRKVAVAS
jgi:succinate dehydrogenase / fumarate reductase iron-sulfur subunit